MSAASSVALLASYQRSATATWAAGTTDAGAGPGYTFSSHAIGTASADRVVVVAIYGGFLTTARAVSTVTIGGNSATVYATQVDVAPARPKLAFAFLPVPTGTTANIVVTWNGTMDFCTIGVWAVTGVGSISSIFSSASDVNAGAGATRTINNLVVPAGGAIIAISGFVDTTAGLTDITWTGVTEVGDIAGETANTRIGFASLSNQVSSSGFTLTATANLDSDLGSALMAVTMRVP